MGRKLRNAVVQIPQGSSHENKPNPNTSPRWSSLLALNVHHLLQGHKKNSENKGHACCEGCQVGQRWSPPANAGDERDGGSIPVWERSPGVGNATHSSVLAWKTPWTEEPGSLLSVGCKASDTTKQLSVHTQASLL